MYILGYMASQNRLYLIDREFSVVSYTLLMSAIEFKTLVLREEVAAAFELLPQIPEEQHSGLARFLESRDLKREALQVCAARALPPRFPPPFSQEFPYSCTTVLHNWIQAPQTISPAGLTLAPRRSFDPGVYLTVQYSSNLFDVDIVRRAGRCETVHVGPRF